MPYTKIHRELKLKGKQYFNYNTLIGYSRYTRNILPSKLTLLENDKPQFEIREPASIVYFLKNIPLLGPLFSIFISSKFIVLDCETGQTIGKSLNTWRQPIIRYTINGDLFNLGIHNDEKFSLCKNGIQIGLYEKAKISRDGKNVYSVWYSDDVLVTIVQLFCILIDILYFDHDGMSIPIYEKTKIVVHRDPEPDRAMWRPES